MIEVNKKAKPYHPCESLIGADLFHLLRRSQLIGRNYYDPTRPTPNKDMVAQVSNNISINSFISHAAKFGLVGKFVNEGLDEFHQLQRPLDGGGMLTMYLCSNASRMENLLCAQEMCKYLQAHSSKPLDKDHVINIHQLVMRSVGVKLAADGAFEQLMVLPEDPQEAPHPIGLGAWAAQGAAAGGWGAGAADAVAPLNYAQALEAMAAADAVINNNQGG